MSLCVPHVHGAHGSRRRVPGPGSHELLDVGGGSRTWVLWEGSLESLGLSPDLSETLVHVKIPTTSHRIDQPPGSTLEILMP